MEIINTSLPFLGVMSSEIGGRSENQDTCGFTESKRGLLLVVCDGMGGGPAGKTASIIATKVIIDFVMNGGSIQSLGNDFVANPIKEDGDESDNHTVEEETKSKKPKKVPKLSDSQLLEQAIKAANSEMRKQILMNPELAGMGTTAAVMLINKDKATMAHVGDSRIYQIRNGRMIFRTSDHSRVGEMVRAGALSEEQARLSAFSNVITRALGIGEDVEVELDERPFEKGDRFVICTDGIWGAKPQKEMIKLFAGNPKSLEGTIDVLNLNVENAGKQKGGKHDNYTAIIIETKIDSTLKETMSRKVKRILQGLGILCILSIALNIVLICVFPSSEKKKGDEIENIKMQQQLLEENTNLTQQLDKAQATIKTDSIKISQLTSQLGELEGKLSSINAITAKKETIEHQNTTSGVKHKNISKVHVVQDKEVLSTLAKKYGVTVDQIKEVNDGIDVDHIKAGDRINIPAK